MISSIIIKNDDLKECYKIRYEVFVNEQKFDEKIEIDEIDDIAYHILVMLDDTYIATARFFLKDNKFKVGRLCVLKKYRKYKVGSYMLKEIENKIKELDYNEVHLSSQYQAINFYIKNNYEKISDIYLEEGVEHVMMRKIL